MNRKTEVKKKSNRTKYSSNAKHSNSSKRGNTFLGNVLKNISNSKKGKRGGKALANEKDSFPRKRVKSDISAKDEEKQAKKKNITEADKISKKRNRKRILVLIGIIAFICLIFYIVSLIKWRSMMKDIILFQNSTIVDSTGKVIAVVGENRIQKNVDYNKVPSNLKNAYVSIEDKKFWSHKGISFKRTGGAILSYITHKGSGSYGGSTITQQLVKNITGENETKISRKVVEWDRAVKTELILSKDEILEAYFNVIYVGPNIYGVDRGAKYYFDKNVEDLSLAECAFMAGLNHSPNSYNPFNGSNNSDKIKDRTCIVLQVMRSEGYISEEEYNNAVDEVNAGLKFKKGEVESNGSGVYSYLADATINEAIQDLAKEKNISVSFATNYLYFGGLTVNSTQNSDIQKIMEDEMNKKAYQIKSSKNKDVTSQAAMVIIDQKNGYVVGCVGGLGEKTTPRGFNRATQAVRQTGSAIKPIAVVGPALEENIITPVSRYDDSPTTFENNYQPNDFDKPLGEITVRRAIESSQNIPFVKIMEQLTSKKAIKYMESQGITTLTEKDNALPIALGGLDKGISPIEMCGAYASIANNGVYVTPTFYTSIQNKKGKIILKKKTKNKKVYSPNTAYVLKELLTQPVNGTNGTAKICRIPGFETAAKTGTTDNFYDKWLCGFTEHYTAVTWFGFDESETIMDSGVSNANLIWSNVMKEIHKNLINKNFTMPAGVQQVEVCSDSGKIAGDSCRNTYIEYFRDKNVVTEVCDKRH